GPSVFLLLSLPCYFSFLASLDSNSVVGYVAASPWFYHHEERQGHEGSDIFDHNFVLVVTFVVGIVLSSTRTSARTSRLFHGRLRLRGAYELASIYTLHVMTHAKTQAEVTNNQCADDGQSNDEDADDTRGCAIADSDRRQLQSHERERHGIARGKQNDAAGSAGGADEVHNCQEHQTWHEQRQPNLEVSSDPSRS